MGGGGGVGVFNSMVDRYSMKKNVLRKESRLDAKA